MHYSKPAQDAINYTNENLTAPLSLEALADYVHFSSQAVPFMHWGGSNGICTAAASQGSITGFSINEI